MAKVLANTGSWFPFFSPMLGWLGVFITGSDTSANALFGKLQYATAVSIGVDPVLTVGANVSGGVVGKMISPQSIAIAAAAGQLVGKEADLFRFTVKHSFIMLFLICLLTLAQAYLFSGVIPVYTQESNSVTAPGHAVSTGYIYLAILALILIGIATFMMRVSKNKSRK
jgi:lactate permease